MDTGGTPYPPDTILARLPRGGGPFSFPGGGTAAQPSSDVGKEDKHNSEYHPVILLSREEVTEFGSDPNMTADIARKFGNILMGQVFWDVLKQAIEKQQAS